MKYTAIHQITAGFALGDAISTEVLALRDICRGMGLPSEIFVPWENTTQEARKVVRPLEEHPPQGMDLLIYHYSIQSRATEVFRRFPGRKVVIYHNITPAEFFQPYDEKTVRLLAEGRQGLGEVAALADEVWAVSVFNAQEIKATGVAKRVKVFPLLFSLRLFDEPPNATALQGLSTPNRKILFVGRMAPNKCVEELIDAFAWYHKCIERRSELILIGSDRNCARYFAMLRLYAGELDLMSVRFVRFTSQAELVAYYQKADVFVCPSRHEGYCLPVVEAMYKGVPVIARNIGGIPEAMDGAGVLYDEAKPEELAQLMNRVITDGGLRSDILAGQQARIQRLLARNVPEEFQGLLNAL